MIAELRLHKNKTKTKKKNKLMESNKPEKVLNLNLYKAHFSLVTDMDKYTLFHMCSKFQMFFHSKYNLRRNNSVKKDCIKVKCVYPGGSTVTRILFQIS